MLLSQLVNLIMQQTPGRLASNRGSFTDGTTVEAMDPATLVTPGAGSQQTGTLEEAALGESSTDAVCEFLHLLLASDREQRCPHKCFQVQHVSQGLAPRFALAGFAAS